MDPQETGYYISMYIYLFYLIAIPLVKCCNINKLAVVLTFTKVPYSLISLGNLHTITTSREFNRLGSAYILVQSIYDRKLDRTKNQQTDRLAGQFVEIASS